MVYIEDPLIFSEDKKSNDLHLNTVLTRLKINELYKAPIICDFFKGKFDFLGVLTENNCVKVNPNKSKI